MKIITVDLPNSIVNNNKNLNNFKPKIKKMIPQKEFVETEPIPQQLIFLNQPIILITMPNDPGREEEIKDYLSPPVIVTLRKCLAQIKCKCELTIK